MSERVLYDFELDANCYKVRLALSMMDLSFRTVAVDAYPGREQQKAGFLSINPLGRIPVLVDDGLVVDGAQAILAHLARAAGHATSWLPDARQGFAMTMQWLMFAQSDLACALTARDLALFGTGSDLEQQRLANHSLQAFEQMEDHMLMRQADGATWFVAEGPTIADLALFPAFALSRDFGVDHEEFPALRRWSRRLRQLKGFITMPGIPDYH